MSNRELTVKVKLVSDNTNPGASPILGTGGSPALGGGIPGATGNSSSTGNANPLAQNAQKAADNLKTFDQHLAKAAESLNALRDSSKGMLGALKQALFTGGGNSQASPGHVQSLMTMGKQFLGKNAMPMAVGGMAMGAAGAIVGGVNMADNFMTSRGAKPWLGHGSYDRNASGQLYDLSPTRIMNQMEVSTIGGGTINDRGDIRSWDQHHDVIKNRFSEAMRRTSMQSPAQSIEANTNRQLSDLRMDASATRNHYASYRDYAVDATMATESFSGGMSGLMKQSQASLEKLHGPDIGKMMAAQERFGVGMQSQAYGQQMAEAQAKRKENAANIVDTQSEFQRQKELHNTILSNKAPGDNGQVGKDEEESKSRLIALQEKLLNLTKQEFQLKDQVASLSREQVKAQKDAVNQKLSAVMQSKLQEAQTLQGQKEAFGMMDEGDQDYHKDIAERFKGGGISAITSEERGILQNSPLGEDVRIAARKRAEEGGFADIYRGSRAEARNTELTGQQGQLEKMQVELTKIVNINVQTDKEETARAVTVAVGSIISSLQVDIRSNATLQTRAAENQAQLAGQQRSGANP